MPFYRLCCKSKGDIVLINLNRRTYGHQLEDLPHGAHVKLMVLLLLHELRDRIPG